VPDSQPPVLNTPAVDPSEVIVRSVESISDRFEVVLRQSIPGRIKRWLSKGRDVLRVGLDSVQENPRLAVALGLLVMPIGSIGWLLRSGTGVVSVESVPALFALAAVNAALTLLMLFWVGSLTEERRELIEEGHRYEKRELEQRGRILRLEEDVDLLTAMRDVSRILNDDVQFDRIWGRILEIVHALVRSEEIAIWVFLDETLQPRVHQRGSTLHFGDQIDTEELDSSGVTDAVDHQTVIRLVEGRVLSLVFPLAADSETLGVLKVTLSLAGDFQERLGMIEETERVISNFLEHISLAIKTPTLYDMAVVDGLTGLYTKRHLLHELASLFKIVRRHGKQFSFILLDVDHFKSINDTYGHPTGDEVLKQVSSRVGETARECDSAYRYGGEEICLVLPETGLKQAVGLAERLRERIAGEAFIGEQGEELKITASFGVAECESDLTDVARLISRADQSLYRSKEGGRNQVWFWSKSPQPSRSARKRTSSRRLLKRKSTRRRTRRVKR
jgi:diguanylate cyclase (GGDEF)-like protein